MSYSFSETFYYLQKFLLQPPPPHPTPPHGKIGVNFILKLWLFLSPELSGYYKLIKFYFQLLFFQWLDFYSVTLECKQSSNPYELLLEQLGKSNINSFWPPRSRRPTCVQSQDKQVFQVMTQILEAHMQMVQMQLARQQQETRQFQRGQPQPRDDCGGMQGSDGRRKNEGMGPSFLLSNIRVFCFINFSLKHLATHLIWLYIITWCLSPKIRAVDLCLTRAPAYFN